MTETMWAVVELMGRVRYGGILTEEERFGGKVGRVDVPDGDKFVTVLFGAQSVYRVTVVTEEVARQVAKSSQPAPVHPWDYPREIANEAPPITVRRRREDDNYDYDQDEDDQDEDDTPY